MAARTQRIEIRVSADEFKQLQTAANSAGVNVSNYLRQQSLSGEIQQHVAKLDKSFGAIVAPLHSLHETIEGTVHSNRREVFNTHARLSQLNDSIQAVTVAVEDLRRRPNVSSPAPVLEGLNGIMEIQGSILEQMNRIAGQVGTLTTRMTLLESELLGAATH
jgi:hypothetical protein